MAKRVIFEELDFQGEIIVPEIECCEFQIERDGYFDGFVFDLEIILDELNIIRTLDERTNWSTPYIKVLSKPIFLKKGSKIRVKYFKKVFQACPNYKIEAHVDGVPDMIQFEWKSANRWA